MLKISGFAQEAKSFRNAAYRLSRDCNIKLEE
jgi:hypothetical protein